MNTNDDPCYNELQELLKAVEYYEKHENKKMTEKLRIIRGLSKEDISKMANDPTYSPKGLEDWLTIADEQLKKATKQYLDCRKKSG